MATIKPNIVPGHWLVKLRPYASDGMKASHLSLLREKTADSTPFNCDIQRQFDFLELRGWSGKMDNATKAEIEAMDEVDAIEPVQRYKHCDIQSDAPWGLGRLSARTKLSGTVQGKFEYKYEATGEGTVAYVLDSGINHEHVDFEGRAIRGPKIVANQTVSDEDTFGHGTHCAGTIASKTYGVAKQATVVGVKVFNDVPEPNGPVATNDDIIGALEWVLKDVFGDPKTGKRGHKKPSVVNLSLGGGSSDGLDKAIAATVRAGIVVCVAAGNETRPADTGSPAREPLAITVGATDINDELAWFSNYGKMVDILAPGVSIKSTWYNSKTATKVLEGTSMACPHVTGAVCCWLNGQTKNTLETVPQLLIWAEKNKIAKLKERTINALLHTSDT